MTRSMTSGLLLCVLVLMGVGLVQVYSSSYIFAIESYGDGLYFFKRQLFFVLASLVSLLFFMSIPFEWIRKYGVWLWVGASIFVIVTLVPGVGVRVGGALRWIQLPGGFRFEPSELLKTAFPLLAATWAIRQQHWLKRWSVYWLIPFIVIPWLLLLKQPDFGTFAILSIVSFVILFSMGLRWKWIISGAVTMATAFYFLVMTVPYRRQRVFAFLDPWADSESKGFQVIQSLLSFHSGGLWGQGLGQGQGKLFFLPEAHTDFTLAVLGEELGYVGFTAVLLIYGYIIFRCFQISTQTEDRFSKVLALGFGTIFGLSVFVNAGVVMGLLPTKGLTLPFLSYGGSSLLCLSILMGILINLENQQMGESLSERLRRLRVKR